MADKESPAKVAIDEIAGGISKHGGRFLLTKYGPSVALAISAVVATHLTLLAAAVGRAVLMDSGIFFVSLFVGLGLLFRQRTSGPRRSPEMQRLIEGIEKQIRGENQSVAEGQLHAGFDQIISAMASARATY